MVSPMENWTTIRAAVLDAAAASSLEGYAAVRIRILTLEAVPGYVSLPSEFVGREVELLLSESAMEELAPVPGEELRARVRRGREPRRLFADERTVGRVRS